MLHGYWLRTSTSAAHRMCSSYANWRRPKSWYYEVSVVSPLTPASVDSIREKKTQMLGVLHFVFTVYNLTPFVFQRSAFRSFRFSSPVVYLSFIVVSSFFRNAFRRIGSFILWIIQSELPHLMQRPFFACFLKLQAPIQTRFFYMLRTGTEECTRAYMPVSSFFLRVDPTSGELRATRPRYTSFTVLLTH